MKEDKQLMEQMLKQLQKKGYKMQGTILSKVQKNLQDLRTEVKTIIRESQLSPLPHIHKRSQQKTISHSRAYLVPSHRRASLMKQPKQPQHTKHHSISIRQSDPADYKIIFMKSQKTKHHRKLASPHLISEHSVDVCKLNENSSLRLEHLLTEKSTTIEHEKTDQKTKERGRRFITQKKNEHYKIISYLRSYIMNKSHTDEPENSELKKSFEQHQECRPWDSFMEQEAIDPFTHHRY